MSLYNNTYITVTTFNQWLLPIDDRFQALITRDSDKSGIHQCWADISEVLKGYRIKEPQCRSPITKFKILG